VEAAAMFFQQEKSRGGVATEASDGEPRVVTIKDIELPRCNH